MTSQQEEMTNTDATPTPLHPAPTASRALRPGRLSRHYACKSRSFSQLSDVLKTGHGESALALGKKRTAVEYDVLEEGRDKGEGTSMENVFERAAMDLHRLTLNGDGQQCVVRSEKDTLVGGCGWEQDTEHSALRRIRRKLDWIQKTDRSWKNHVLEKEM